MGWLDELKYDYLYVCDCGLELVSEVRDTDIMCDCGRKAPYVKMLPIQVGITGKVAYDQNGRKAFMLPGKNGGRPTYISASKYHYMETGKIEHKYTDAYREKLAREAPDSLEVDNNNRRANVKPARVRR